MGALTKDKVGAYVNTHFVSAAQKVGTFTIAGKEKNGGNVASYFCTSEGNVLHVIAGPVDADTFLQEARWVVETMNMLHLENIKAPGPAREFMRRAHQDRLRKEHALGRHVAIPSPTMNLGSLVDRLHGMSNQGKIHYLLTAHPAPRLEQIYRVVFENILKEKISTGPVKVAGK